jgi:hypothetical protein
MKNRSPIFVRGVRSATFVMLALLLVVPSLARAQEQPQAETIYMCLGDTISRAPYPKTGFQPAKTSPPKMSAGPSKDVTAKFSNDNLSITANDVTGAPVEITVKGDVASFNNGDQVQHVDKLYRIIVIDCSFTDGDWFRHDKTKHAYGVPHIQDDGDSVAVFKDLGDSKCYPAAKSDAEYALGLVWDAVRDEGTKGDDTNGTRFKTFKESVDDAIGDPDDQAKVDGQLGKLGASSAIPGGRRYLEYEWKRGDRHGFVYAIEGKSRPDSTNVRVLVVITGFCPCLEDKPYKHFVAIVSDVFDAPHRPARIPDNPQQHVGPKDPDQIRQVCCTPDGPGPTPQPPRTPTGNPPATSEKPKSTNPTPTPTPTPTAGDHSLRTIVPAPGMSSSGNVTLPPWGSGDTIVMTVEPNPSPSPGEPTAPPNGTAQGVLLVTETQDGTKHYEEATPHDGLLTIATTALGGGLATIGIVREFDPQGQPVVTSTMHVGDPPHIEGTEPVRDVPPSGPAIRETNPTIQPGETMTVHLQGNDPATTRFLLDGKPLQTLAVSNNSALVRFDSELGPGHSQLVMETHDPSDPARVVRTVPLTIDIVKLTAHPLPVSHPGVTESAIVDVAGLEPSDRATMTFTLEGGAARIVGGGTTITVPVTNDQASVQLLGQHAGQVMLHYRLNVANPQFTSSSG